MKKIMIFFLVVTFVAAGLWSQGVVQKYSGKMVKKKTHMEIVYPEPNHVFFLPQAATIKVKLIRPAKVLFHVWDLSRGGVKKQMLEENKLRKARDGTYRGVVTFSLKAGRYHVIAAPQTNLGKDSEPAGPIKFSVRLKLKPIPVKKK